MGSYHPGPTTQREAGFGLASGKRTRRDQRSAFLGFTIAKDKTWTGPWGFPRIAQDVSVMFEVVGVQLRPVKYHKRDFPQP